MVNGNPHLSERCVDCSKKCTVGAVMEYSLVQNLFLMS